MIRWNLGVGLLVLASSAFSNETTSEQNILEAKQSIYELVEVNAERIDNFPEVRAELENYVNIILSNTNGEKKGFEEKVGIWKQLWTDDADDLRANNAFQTTDRRRTYQVVFDNGFFYNLTEVKTLLGRFSGFLRGVYELDGEVLNLEFTKLRLKRGNLGPEEDLGNLTTLFEEGKLKNTFKIPGSDKYPNGPVGATGKIRTVYIDDDMRIDVGSNDADGVDDLFILRRILN